MTTPAFSDAIAAVAVPETTAQGAPTLCAKKVSLPAANKDHAAAGHTLRHVHHLASHAARVSTPMEGAHPVPAAAAAQPLHPGRVRATTAAVEGTRSAILDATRAWRGSTPAREAPFAVGAGQAMSPAQVLAPAGRVLRGRRRTMSTRLVSTAPLDTSLIKVQIAKVATAVSTSPRHGAAAV